MEYIPAKTIVTKTKSTSWFGTDYNMNIYKGCCHGCIYCDSRSLCYRIEQFDQVRAKEDALRIIRDDLRRKVKRGVIGTGSMSDPYNPFEKELLLTRNALVLAEAFGFGVAVATKSNLITRDADILCDIKKESPVICKITITTMDDDLAKKIEPGAPVSSKRFEALGTLREQGLFAGILLMPVLPFLEDNPENIIGIVRKAASLSASFIYPFFGMTLREGQRSYYYQKLVSLFPDTELVEIYKKRYDNRYECHVENGKKLWSLFAKECENYGILYRMQDIINAYKGNYGVNQFHLFDYL